MGIGIGTSWLRRLRSVAPPILVIAALLWQPALGQDQSLEERVEAWLIERYTEAEKFRDLRNITVTLRVRRPASGAAPADLVRLRPYMEELPMVMT